MGILKWLCISSTLLIIMGCHSQGVSTTRTNSIFALAENSAGSRCQVLGEVTASADCACYDKMSYDAVRGRASSNLRQRAHAEYPDTDLVEISSVDLYLNNAVAHGVAYKCTNSS